MKFTELVNTVANLTNRPELQEEIKNAVMRSTLKMHAIDFFPRDLKVQSFVVNSAKGEIDISQAFKNFRKINKVVGQTLQEKLIELKPLSFNDIIGFNSATKIGYFFSGNKIVYKSRELLYSIFISAFTFPEVSEHKYDSWIADLYPYAIIDDACASVYEHLGDIDAANRFLAKVGSKDSDNLSAHIPTILAEQLYDADIPTT